MNCRLALFTSLRVLFARKKWLHNRKYHRMNHSILVFEVREGITAKGHWIPSSGLQMPCHITSGPGDRAWWLGGGRQVGGWFCQFVQGYRHLCRHCFQCTLFSYVTETLQVVNYKSHNPSASESHACGCQILANPHGCWSHHRWQS